MKTEHTPEPWGVTDSRFIRQVSSPRHVVARIVGSDEMETNARRIVACVNACAGISTENLEDNKPLIELAMAYNVALRQRDELLAVLERVSLELGIDGLLPEWEFVDEAIASVKEKS